MGFQDTNAEQAWLQQKKKIRKEWQRKKNEVGYI